jgi:hypothetical protein
MTITLNTNEQFNEFIQVNRKQVTNINGVEFNEMYPMIESNKKNAHYYDAPNQCNQFLYPPFTIEVKTN